MPFVEHILDSLILQKESVGGQTKESTDGHRVSLEGEDHDSLPVGFVDVPGC